jgi:hypothetical protein
MKRVAGFVGSVRKKRTSRERRERELLVAALFLSVFEILDKAGGLLY